MAGFDHRQLIAGLSSNERKSLLTQSNGPGLRQLALHWGTIGVCTWFILNAIPGWQAVLVLQGVLIIFLFTPLHETIHLTAFRTDWLNRFVALVCGFLVLTPPVWFRYFHLAHHRYTHDPENDPELATPKPQSVWQYLLDLTGGPVWLSLVRTIVTNAAGWGEEQFVPVRGLTKVRREAQVFLATCAFLLLGSLWLQTSVLFWIWVLPAILGQPFLRLYLRAEHTGCPHVQNMLDNTRTTYTTIFVRFIAWNMPYHTEHHAYPAVPFHNLPRFHKLMRDHIIHSEQGYSRFHGKYVAGLAKKG